MQGAWVLMLSASSASLPQQPPHLRHQKSRYETRRPGNTVDIVVHLALRVS